MQEVFVTLIGITALVFFAWLLIPNSTANQKRDDDEFIDPSDSRQLGLLVGMYGGNVADAALVRFALERFERIHGRRATTRDMGIVIGLMNLDDTPG